MGAHFTIGMAGHIDHGKTTLTKALTGVDTDRLKEEKERKISIEPGFAPLIQEEDLFVSIVDVPGHERFIRQAIAGVAGIDMVLLVIAADEGVMPQTVEHLNILTLLGIEYGCIVLTKIDQTDEDLLELVEEDIKEHVKHTFLESATIHYVDSISGKGLQELKEALREMVRHLPEKSRNTAFRLPIDHVFTVKGQGAVVRGTIYDGSVRVGDRLTVLPLQKEVRVRQIQSHNKQMESASAGQRTALNLRGVSYEEVSRGDVLVADDSFTVTNQIDVVFYPSPLIKYRIKQRQQIKLYIGTSEVLGKLVFFDRNELSEKENEEILCQIQLSESVVVTRGDRFIIRRATPIETIGGGWIIEPNGKKHRFGDETVEQLRSKKEGSLSERITLFMEENIVATYDEIMSGLTISDSEWVHIQPLLDEVEKGLFSLTSTRERLGSRILHIIETFHNKFSMRSGINKAEIVSVLKEAYPLSVIDFTLKSLNEEQKVTITNQFIALNSFERSLPLEWKTRLERAEDEMERAGAEVGEWREILTAQGIPEQIQNEYVAFAIQTGRVLLLEEDRIILKAEVEKLKNQLYTYTKEEDFNLQIARDALQLSRKNLVPLLELFDRLEYTEREGNMRKWLA